MHSRVITGEKKRESESLLLIITILLLFTNAIMIMIAVIMISVVATIVAMGYSRFVVDFNLPAVHHCLVAKLLVGYYCCCLVPSLPPSTVDPIKYWKKAFSQQIDSWNCHSKDVLASFKFQEVVSKEATATGLLVFAIITTTIIITAAYIIVVAAATFGLPCFDFH